MGVCLPIYPFVCTYCELDMCLWLSYDCVSHYDETHLARIRKNYWIINENTCACMCRSIVLMHLWRLLMVISVRNHGHVYRLCSATVWLLSRIKLLVKQFNKNLPFRIVDVLFIVFFMQFALTCYLTCKQLQVIKSFWRFPVLVNWQILKMIFYKGLYCISNFFVFMFAHLNS